MEKIWSGVKNSPYYDDDSISRKIEIYLVGGTKIPFRPIRLIRTIEIEKETNEVLYDTINIITLNGENISVINHFFDESSNEVADFYGKSLFNSFLLSDDKELINLINVYPSIKEMRTKGFKFQEFGHCDDSISRYFDSSDSDYEYADEIVKSDCYSLIEYKSVNGCIFARFNGYEFEKFSSQFEFDYEADNCNTGLWGAFKSKCA